MRIKTEVLLLQNIAFLKYAYDEPCDVDFGVGGSMHSSTDGDLLSDLHDRVIALQFRNTKCGDPFFYTNVMDKGNLLCSSLTLNKANSSSTDQLEFIDYFSFKQVLCFTLSDLPDLQHYVFLTAGKNNQRGPCEGEFSLEGWKLRFDPNHPATNIPTNPPEQTTVFEDELQVISGPSESSSSSHTDE